MAVDVLDDDDGVVDKDADGEDEGEEADPVEGVAEEVRRGQGQGQRHRDDDRDDDGLTSRQGDPHEEDHRERRRPQVGQQLVGLLLGGGAVVAGLEDLDVRRDDPALEPGEDAIDVGDHVDGIGAGLLGHRERDGRKIETGPLEALLGGARTGAEPDVGTGLLGTVRDLGDILEIDRPAAVHAHHDVADIVGIGEELADVDEDLGVGDGGRSRRKTPVDALECLIGLEERDVERREPFAVEIHPDDPALTPDDPDLGDPRVFGDLDLEFVGHPPELGGRGVFAPQGVRNDRDVVDGPGLDHGRDESFRELVHHRRDLGVDPNRGLIGVGPHQEADDDEPARRPRDRVDVLDVFDLVEQLLERRDDPVLDLFGGGAREADHDVDHGHLDLGLLFGWGDEEGEAAEEQ